MCSCLKFCGSLRPDFKRILFLKKKNNLNVYANNATDPYLLVSPPCDDLWFRLFIVVFICSIYPTVSVLSEFRPFGSERAVTEVVRCSRSGSCLAGDPATCGLCAHALAERQHHDPELLCGDTAAPFTVMNCAECCSYRLWRDVY